MGRMVIVMPNFNIIKPSVERIDEKDNLKRIELAGRVCYKSESRITEDSAEAFCKRILASGHHSVLEHSNLIVKVPRRIFDKIRAAIAYYEGITAKKSHLYHEYVNEGEVLVSGNMRAWRDVLAQGAYSLGFAGDPILDRDNVDDLTPYIVTPDTLPKHVRHFHDRITLRIVCDRGVSHELVRHRVMSFSQESTRYVNYGKRGYTFIEPWWWNEMRGVMKHYMLANMQRSVDTYQLMIDEGATPQLARAILPNQIKTEVVVTATPLQWAEFLILRMSKAAHPDMQRVAHLVREALGADVRIPEVNGDE